MLVRLKPTKSRYRQQIRILGIPCGMVIFHYGLARSAPNLDKKIESRLPKQLIERLLKKELERVTKEF